MIKDEPVYNDLVNTSKDNLWPLLTIFGFLGLVFIVISFWFRVEKPSDYLIELFSNKENLLIASNVSMTLGTITLTALLVNFLHSTNAFSKLMLKEFNKAITSKHFIKIYNEKEIEDLVHKIQEYHSYIKIDNSKLAEDSICIAQKDTEKLILDAKFSNFKEDKKVQRRAEQNYFIRESNHIRTIMRNGVEISSYKIDTKIIKNGTFMFFYKFSSDNNTRDLPNFSNFSHNINHRFENDSFYADILEYKRNGEIRNSNNCLNVQIIEESKKEIEIAMIVTDCYEGDEIKLSFSLSVKDEVLPEAIKKQRNALVTSYKVLNSEKLQPEEEVEVDESTVSKKKKEVKPLRNPASKSVNPIGIRRVKVQQERYGKGSKDLQLSPSIKVGETQVVPVSEEKSIFYESTEWVIYYKEHPGRGVIFSLI